MAGAENPRPRKASAMAMNGSPTRFWESVKVIPSQPAASAKQAPRASRRPCSAVVRTPRALVLRADPCAITAAPNSIAGSFRSGSHNARLAALAANEAMGRPSPESLHRRALTVAFPRQLERLRVHGDRRMQQVLVSGDAGEVLLDDFAGGRAPLSESAL